MKNLPVEVSEEDIEEMFEFADKNKDGKLSYKEFKESTYIYIEFNSFFNSFFSDKIAVNKYFYCGWLAGH